MGKIKVTLLVFAAWLILLSKFDFSFQLKKSKYTISWNGAIWVLLDYYTISKYNSADKPMKLIEIH